jgi:hypothetical protein
MAKLSNNVLKLKEKKKYFIKVIFLAIICPIDK